MGIYAQNECFGDLWQFPFMEKAIYIAKPLIQAPDESHTEMQKRLFCEQRNKQCAST